MPAKKRITIGDVLAHVRGLGGRIDSLDRKLTGKIDSLEGKIYTMDQRLTHMDERLIQIDQRLIRMETSLVPSHERLQITVRDHGGRIRRLEKRARFVAA